MSAFSFAEGGEARRGDYGDDGCLDEDGGDGHDVRRDHSRGVAEPAEVVDRARFIVSQQPVETRVFGYPSLRDLLFAIFV